jgi:hypothetical protein
MLRKLILNIISIQYFKDIIRRKKSDEKWIVYPLVELFKEEPFGINYFLYPIYQGVVFIKKIFRQYPLYEIVIGLLFTSHKLQLLDDATLEFCWLNLVYHITRMIYFGDDTIWILNLLKEKKVLQ